MIALIIVVGSAVGFVILTSLALVGGSTYSVEDTAADPVNYAGIIDEGHGGMTLFLWLTFGLIVVWSIYYLVGHWHEVSGMFFG